MQIDNVLFPQASPTLVLALATLAKAKDDPTSALGLIALQVAVGHVPATPDDAMVLLIVAGAMAEPESKLAAYLARAVDLIAVADYDEALCTLADIVPMAQADNQFLVDRLALNVMGSFVPHVLSLRAALPWEALAPAA